MEKLHSQLPQPLKRCSPSRHGDLVTQIKNGNSPLLSNRSPARRVATSSPNNIRSSPRDVTAVATLTAKQPEAKARSPEVPGRSRDTATTPTRRPKYSPAAANGNMSPTARGKILSRAAEAAVVSERKQSPAKSLAAKQHLRIKTAQVRTLSPSVESMSNQPYAGRDDEEPLWAQNSQARSSGTKKSFSPKYERRGCFKKAEQLDSVEDEAAKNDAGGGGGSPIYHELDPPGTCRFPVQHTYQSIVEISDELESLRLASTKPQAGGGEDAGHQLARARSAQELTQKSPTTGGGKLSLFSRFRFAASKKSSAAKTSGKAELPRPLCAPEVSGQRSLQDVDLITRSRDEVGAVADSSHDRQPSFSTFAHRATASAASRDADGYSSVYVPQNFPPDVSVARVPPRTSSLNPPDSHLPAPPEPLYKQKFLKIASVHTLQNASVDEERAPCLTSSNSVGDLLLATNVAHQSPRRVTSYDDHAVATGSRKMAARVRKQTDARAQTARCGGLSPGRGGAASFSSPSCGIRMAEMRGAVRRCTTSPTRSPSSSTPLPSPARLSVFQFNVPPAGVMLSPPVHRAYRHVSSQTVTSVRPPGASCVLSVTAVHSPTAGPPGQMQTIEEEEDSTNDELKSVPLETTVARQPSVDETATNGAQVVRARVSDDAGRKLAEDDSGTDGIRRTASEGTSTVSRTSKLRRPSPTVSAAAKPLCTHAPPGSSPLPEHHPSRIVPPSANSRRRTESSSVSPPSTPRSVDAQARSGSAHGELVRRQYTRGPHHQQQQHRKQVAPPAEGDATTTAGQIVDALSVPGVLRKPCLRRLPVAAPAHTDGSASSNASSGSSLSLLSTGSDAPVPAASADGLRGSPPAPESSAAVGEAAIQPRHSASSKLNELTVLPAADHVNY